MTLSARMLTLADMPGIAAVVASRQKFLSNAPAEPDAQTKAINARLERGSCIMGLFEGRELDAFFEWRDVGQVPRADDVEDYERGAVVISQWSRAKRGGRAKLPSGHDINSGHLLNAAIGAMDAQGLFTYWYVTPAAWVNTPQRSNPLHVEMASKRIARVGGLLRAGQVPEGDYADFIASFCARNVMPEDMAAHVSTLKDAYRHARS